MKARLILTVLVVLLTASSGQLNVGDFAVDAQPQGPEVVVEAAVTDALQTSPDVEVFVSLRAPGDGSFVPTVEELRQNAAERGARVLSTLSPGDLEITWQYELIHLITGRITHAGLEKLASHEDVLRIALPPMILPSMAESVPVIHADYVHGQGIDGTGVTVAVLDSGIDSDHPDLDGAIAGEVCLLLQIRCPPDYNTNTRFGPGSAEDDQGHGTLVSGVLTSEGVTAPPGVAPGSSIFAYKVCDYNISCSGIFRGLEDIMENHPGEFAAIVMSMHDVDRFAGDCDLQEPAFALPLEVIRSQGTLPVASVGNDGDKSRLPAPACISHVVSVGATYDADVGEHRWVAADCDDLATAADKVGCGSNSSDQLDLLAPGSIITTTSFDGQTAPVSGTSFAAPHAAGVIGLMVQASPALTPDQIVDRLKWTGKLVTDAFNDGDPGTGRTTPRVDARVALLTNDGDDFDQDGCTNGQEFGSNQFDGGQRNPLSFWDFFDVPTGTAY